LTFLYLKAILYIELIGLYKNIFKGGSRNGYKKEIAGYGGRNPHFDQRSGCGNQKNRPHTKRDRFDRAGLRRKDSRTSGGGKDENQPPEKKCGLHLHRNLRILLRQSTGTARQGQKNH